MDKNIVKEIALANGFKLKEQPDGTLELNPYVYVFANKLVDHQQAKVEELQVQLKGAEERAQLTLKYKDKYREERDELQKRVDAGVDKLVVALITMLKQIRANPQAISDMSEQQFNQHLAELEQALKGEV